MWRNSNMLTGASPQLLTQYKAQCRAAFPTHKKYKVIYADPPWEFKSSGSDKIENQATNHYPVMPLKDICELPIKDITDRDCALFLWACNPLLPQAMTLIKEWGFEYKTVFKVWTKRSKNGNPVCAPGWWSRGSTELLLVGTKGSPLKNKTTNSERQEYASIRGAHSEKPDEIRQAVSDFLSVPEGSRLELFGRKTVVGWDVWGLECPSYFYESLSISNVYVDIDRGLRSIGTQTDNEPGRVIKPSQGTKSRGNGSGGITSHKPDCACCICAKIRARHVLAKAGGGRAEAQSAAIDAVGGARGTEEA